MSASTPASVGNIKALIPELSRNFILPIDNTNDFAKRFVQAGLFTNAGAGWNSFTFPQPFDDVPLVLVTAQDGHTVQVNKVTATGFTYKVLSSADMDVTTETCYVFTRASTSSSYMKAINVVTGIGSDDGSTENPVEIAYIAIEKES